MNYFYCCGKLKTISFATQENNKDCKGTKKKGCCKNEKVSVKLKTDHKTADDVKCNFCEPLFATLSQFNDYSINSFTQREIVVQLYKRPPPNYYPQRNILFCVFRI